MQPIREASRGAGRGHKFAEGFSGCHFGLCNCVQRFGRAFLRWGEWTERGVSDSGSKCGGGFGKCEMVGVWARWIAATRRASVRGAVAPGVLANPSSFARPEVRARRGSDEAALSCFLLFCFAKKEAKKARLAEGLRPANRPSPQAWLQVSMVVGHAPKGPARHACYSCRWALRLRAFAVET